MSKIYSKRTWLNKNESPSTGNIVAFDGEVNYNDGKERTTFLSISDCSHTIRITKNTETIAEYIEKLKILKAEIELFIIYIQGEKTIGKFEKIPKEKC
jgi:hypothetical protein